MKWLQQFAVGIALLFSNLLGGTTGGRTTAHSSSITPLSSTPSTTQAASTHSGSAPGIRSESASGAPNDSNSTDQATSSLTIPGMSQYVDSNFGFSFWYPDSWQITIAHSTLDAGTTYGTGAVVLQTISAKDPRRPAYGVSVNEVYSPGMSIYGDPLYDPSPLSSYVNYFFDPTNNSWLVATGRTPQGDSPATTTADTSDTTMGGLPIFSGYLRSSQMRIIPLSPVDFLAIYDNYSEASDEAPPPANAFATFVSTIVSTRNTAAPILLDVAQQRAAIQSEQSAYVEARTNPSTPPQ